MAALTALRILQVRPEQGEDQFARQLVASGATLYRYPVMLITPFTDAPETGLSEAATIKSHILNLDRYQIAIFVSRTAVRLVADWLNRNGTTLPVDVDYYAVGKSTEKLLRELGVEVNVPDKAFSSDGLLALPPLQSVVGKKILIFSGEGGRSLLVDELSQRGASVSECELYRREPTSQFAAQISQLMVGESVDLVVAHSGELLENLLAVVVENQRPILMSLPILVPSERVSDIAIGLGFRTVMCAGSALPEDMVSALRGWYSSR